MKRVLGRGADALFEKTDLSFEDIPQKNDNAEVTVLRTSLVEPRKDQPRKQFDREQLQALANSIAEHGVIQPIVVTKGQNGYYSIIAGERRWRAAKLAGLSEIPAIVRECDEMQIAQIALVENLQREDLNPIEEALGYKALMERFSMTQDKISKKVGKSRSNIANMLRLLSLEDEIKEMLSNGELSVGHARALLSLEGGKTRVDAARKVAIEGLNVRQVESLGNANTPKTKAKTPKESVYPDVERQLSEKFGTKIRIKGNRKGKIEIEYYSVKDLTRIVDILM